jgi:hypothetical protein
MHASISVQVPPPEEEPELEPPEELPPEDVLDDAPPSADPDELEAAPEDELLPELLPLVLPLLPLVLLDALPELLEALPELPVAASLSTSPLLDPSTLVASAHASMQAATPRPQRRMRAARFGPCRLAGLAVGVALALMMITDLARKSPRRP